MRRTAIGLAALAFTAMSGAALAQSSTTIVTDPPVTARPGAPTVVVDPTERPATTGSVETPPGCASTVTRHEAPDGSATTVRKERCNPND